MRLLLCLVFAAQTAFTHGIETNVKYAPCIEYINVKVTVYWGVESQTDSSPDVTAYNTKFNPYNPPRFCAISRDLEKIYSRGDTIMLEGIGELSGAWIVEDRMAARKKNSVDLLTKPGTMGRWQTNIDAKSKVHNERFIHRPGV